VAPRRADDESFPSLDGAPLPDATVWDPVDPDNPAVPNFRQAMVAGWGRSIQEPPQGGAAAAAGGKRKNKRGTVLFTVG